MVQSVMLLYLLLVYEAVVCLDLRPLSPGKNCPPNQVCATRQSCPYWEDKYQRFHQLSSSDPRYEGYRADYTREATRAICNRRAKALCCDEEDQSDPDDAVIDVRGKVPDEDPGSEDDPTFIPGPDNCGSIGDTRNIFGGKSQAVTMSEI